MLKIIGLILVLVLLLAGYFVYKKNPSISKVDQVSSENFKETTEKSPANSSLKPNSQSEDILSRVIVNKPQISDYSMRIERVGGTIQVIMEYRPKGQVNDFPVLTIGRWDIKDRPTDTNFENLTINGKQAKHYKDKQMIFIEDLPLLIKYNRGTGQLGYLSDTEFQSLLNSVQIN